MRRFFDAWLLAAALLPLAFCLNGELVGIDAPQYAEVARRIAASGDWLHLSDTFGPFLNKPPLSMWGQALAISVLGPTSVAARVPHLLFALATVAAVVRLGRVLYGPRAGLWAGALLAASPALQLMVADPKVDAALTCFTTLCVWAAFEARARPFMRWLSWLFAGLAVLAKGPVGLLIPAAALLPEALRRPWGKPEARAASLRQRLGALGLFAGFIIVALVAAPFALATYEQHGPEVPLHFLWKQSFARLFHQSPYADSTTPLFFLHTALWAFFPFVLFLVPELGRAAKAAWRAKRLEPDERRVVGWWLGIPFLALSLADGHLPQYLYWLSPPAALLAAKWLVEAKGGSESLRRLRALGAALAVLVPVGAALFLGFVFPPSRGSTWSWLGLAALVPAASLLAGRARLQRTLELAVGAAVAAMLAFHLHLQPALAAYRPERELGELARSLDPTSPWLCFLDTPASNAAAYYANRAAVEVPESRVAELVRAGQTRLVVVPQGSLASHAELGPCARPVVSLPVGGVSRPTLRFLDPRRRDQTLGQVALLALGSSCAQDPIISTRRVEDVRVGEAPSR